MVARNAVISWVPAEFEVLVKENIEVAGHPFACGSATRSEILGAQDAECVQAVRQAGYRIAGTTCCDEFAYGCTGEAHPTGPCRNPHDHRRITGGSSSGSAAAVAAGLTRYALGTDTAGSVRIPAALCGVYGFKPSYGAISTKGVFPLSRSLDHVGVIADSLGSIVEVWRAATGNSQVVLDCPTLRLGLADTPEAYVVDDEVGRAWRQLVQSLDLTQRGSLLGWDQAPVHGSTVQGFEAYETHNRILRDRPDILQPVVRARLVEASHISHTDYVHARRRMIAFRADASEALGSVDVVVLPTTPVTAPVIGTESVVLGGRRIPVREALLRNTRIANFTGLPALTIPLTGRTRLPAGLQLIGRDDATVLRAGFQVLSVLGISPNRTYGHESSATRAQRAWSVTALDEPRCTR